MASSSTEIGNLALDAIGARATIASVTEASAEARVISRQYNQALEDVLASAHWNFARKQVALTLLKDATDGDQVPVPWVYEYTYPADCVGARYIMPLTAVDPAVAVGTVAAPTLVGPPARFIVSQDLDSNATPIKVILTNQPQAILVYTVRVTNPQLFDGLFTRALAAYLGSLIAIPISGDKRLAQMAFDAADSMVRAARVTNGNEGGPTVIDNVPDWIRVRGYEADLAQPYTAFVMAPTNLVFIA